MSMRSKVRTGATALGLAAAGVALAAGPAAAGTNGQQIRFYDNVGSVYSIRVIGQNEMGLDTYGCFGTPHARTDISGWWWKEAVTVQAFTNGSCSGEPVATNTNVYVPKAQDGDWKNVYFTTNGIVS
ncbi:hypothetical protein ACZ90_69170 [Streptomyces albus subsp. albus]|nr:hypothetical protein ACZ90_69170 [Streptomyces albus subsp. albus]